MGYEYALNSNSLQKSFINKLEILEIVSEEQIYELVFGFIPREYQYVTSPLRKDSNAGCWFERNKFGLVFRDFTYGNKPLDCFDVVQKYFKIPNFYETLKFVKNKLIVGKNLIKRKHTHDPTIKKESVEIYCESRRFIISDKKYWKPFEITKQNLVDDKVFPVSRYQLINSKVGDFDKRVNTLSYVYTDFDNNRKKIYFPKKESNRFVTNCKKNDIGNINDLIAYGSLLIITKSYKDCRVLRNQGMNAIWIQNEGMIPDMKLLMSIVKRFDKIIVFYDNDDQGINASIKLSKLINMNFPGKSAPMWLHPDYRKQGISDPAEMIVHQGRTKLNNLLYNL